jgi:hypothetical protein
MSEEANKPEPTSGEAEAKEKKKPERKETKVVMPVCNGAGAAGAI